MPTYQYRCTECGRDLEVVQKFSDPTLTECPSCQGQLRKVFNAVGVVFKGSGFYRTDSRKGSGGESGGSAEKSDQPGEKKTESGTTEKKTEKKTETAGTSAKAAPSSTGSSSTAA